VAGKDIDISRGIWENYLQEFFDDGALFFVEIDGCGEKQRYGMWSDPLLFSIFYWYCRGLVFWSL